MSKRRFVDDVEEVEKARRRQAVPKRDENGIGTYYMHEWYLANTALNRMVVDEDRQVVVSTEVENDVLFYRLRLHEEDYAA